MTAMTPHLDRALNSVLRERPAFMRTVTLYSLLAVSASTALAQEPPYRGGPISPDYMGEVPHHRGFSNGSPTTCHIADPTGTPLNVRTSPMGKVLHALPNGLEVTIQEATLFHGKKWVFVTNKSDLYDNISGWVFRDYVDCRPTITMAVTPACRVADPTATPLNVRTSPNGRVVSTLENGTTVSILDRTVDGKGQPWVYVGTAEDRMPIGWVFRNFIDCGSTKAAPFNSSSSTGFTQSVPPLIVVECAVVRVTPKDRDPNPGFKVMVSAEFDAGVLKSMDVVHTRVDGQQADRSTQYSNPQLIQRGNIATWIGFRGNQKMTGVLDSDKMTYNEYITRNGRLETEIDTRCHYPQGDGP
jgi:Bacterial SH3 domain